MNDFNWRKMRHSNFDLARQSPVKMLTFHISWPRVNRIGMTLWHAVEFPEDTNVAALALAGHAVLIVDDVAAGGNGLLLQGRCLRNRLHCQRGLTDLPVFNLDCHIYLGY